MTTEAQLFRDAYRLISEHGHVKGRNGSIEVGLCVGEALRVAAGAGHRSLVPVEAYHRAKARLEALCGDLLTSWNDRRWRRRKHILALLERAAVEAERDDIAHLDFEPEPELAAA